MLLVLALLGVDAAFAAEITEELGAARASLVAGDFDSARNQLSAARKRIPEEEAVLNAQTVAQALYLQAMLPRMMGAMRAQDDERLREALVVFPELKWDRELLDDPGQRGFFEALRGEIAQRTIVSTQVPEAMGRAKAYVDGVEHAHGQGVRQGQHLVQIECPGKVVKGAWADFEAEVDWLGMCPEPVDTSLAPVVLAEGTDDFDFGMDEAEGVGPEPLVYVEKPKAPTTRPPPGPIDRRTLFYASGGALVASAAIYAAALGSRAAYDDLQSSDFHSPEELAEQRARTNTQVSASAGLAMAGMGIGAYAMFRGTW